MSMTDGIKVNNQHSYNQYGLLIKSRNIGLPEKKSIRQTVPYMNGYYDFTDLNGYPAWGERIIEFSFDVLEDTPKLLEQKIEQVLRWLGNAHDVDIFDDVLTSQRWHGSYESCEVNYDESGLQAEIKVSFVVYPFKIAIFESYVLCKPDETNIVYNSGVPVPVYLTGFGDGTITIEGNTNTISFDANTKRKELDFYLPSGSSIVTVIGSAAALMYREEVL